MALMTLGRPKQFDENTALEAATNQFWSAGYDATSLQDLLRVMGLSKSSLYETFGSKKQLFLSCVNFYDNEVKRELDELREKSGSSRELVENYLFGLLKEANSGGKPKGCLFVNTTNEISLKDSEIAKAVERGTQRMAKVFANQIKDDIKAGVLAKHFKTEEIVTYLMVSIAGIRTMVKAGTSMNALKPSVRIILAIFD